METLKSLAIKVRDGTLTIHEAAKIGATLEYPTKKHDGEDHYFVGIQDNVFYVVYSILPMEQADVFLLAIDVAMDA